MPCRTILPGISSYGPATIAVTRKCEQLVFKKGFGKLPTRLWHALYSQLACECADAADVLADVEVHDMSPCILFEVEGVLVIHKPPGWEVDVQCVTSAKTLSLWLTRTIWNTSSLQLHPEAVESIGFIHRLDAPCSGLLLVSWLAEACSCLQS